MLRENQGHEEVQAEHLKILLHGLFLLSIRRSKVIKEYKIGFCLKLPQSALMSGIFQMTNYNNKPIRGRKTVMVCVLAEYKKLTLYPEKNSPIN